MPMHLLARLKAVLGARFHALLDHLENPEGMAAQALRELEDQLDGLRQQAAMAVAVERRLERELQRQQGEIRRGREQARLALSQGREDLARWALTRTLQQQD